jgi:hypothetical protein
MLVWLKETDFLSAKQAAKKLGSRRKIVRISLNGVDTPVPRMLKRLFSKAAASEEARRYVPHFVWAVRFLNESWRTEKSLQ